MELRYSKIELRKTENGCGGGGEFWGNGCGGPYFGIPAVTHLGSGLKAAAVTKMIKRWS